jgi:hypothetical protein
MYIKSQIVTRFFERITCGLIFVSLFVLNATTGIAQTTGGTNGSISGSVSINATARVVESIEIESLNDINLGSVSVGALEITINPQNDDGAGKIRVSGRPEAMIRVVYIPQRELTLSDGSSTLLFNYSLSGNATDNQINSELINPSRTDFRLGTDGRFFIWIGGNVDVQNAVFGQYNGEFALEIEYI